MRLPHQPAPTFRRIAMTSFEVIEHKLNYLHTMKELTFTTNIMCGSCLNKVKPKLDAAEQVKEWSVDTASKDKTLKVSIAEDADATDVIAAVRSAGFTATQV